VSRLPLLRRRGLRFRITFTYIVTMLALAAVLSVTTFLAVRSFLEDQRFRFTTRQTILGLLFAREFLGETDADPEQLIASLQTRSGFQTLLVTPGEFYSTTLSLTPEAIPPEIAALVANEQLAYQVTRLDEQRQVVYGAPLPAPGTDLYLFYSLEGIDETLSVLLRVLIVAGIATVIVASIAAQRAAARIIRPLTDVSTAARAVAEGLLETRVRTLSGDEVGSLAASFNEMAAAFQEMLARERRFVANVSHELRTPLATLRTASELLLRHREEFSPGAREAVDLLNEDVINLRVLVEELMEVSEVDAGGARLRMEPLEIRTLSAAVADKHHLAVHIEGPPTTVVSDKARLERILANLLSNAFEHGDGRDVRIRVDRDDAVATIAVSDTGPGIAAEDLPYLFDRFYKTDTSRTRERGGIGLGLAIAFENARLLGGTIDVTSAEAEGTTFTVRLPVGAMQPEAV